MPRPYKILISNLVFALALTLPGAIFAFDDSLVPGQVYQTSNSSSLFYLGEDYHRYVFPNEATYSSWFDSFDNITELENEIINQAPIGGLVTVNPDGETWVKIQSDPKVYTVSNGGLLHWIPTEEAAIALGGANWSERVIDLPDTVFAGYTIGVPVDIFSPTLTFDDTVADTIDKDKSLVEPSQVVITTDNETREISVSNANVAVAIDEPLHFLNNSSDWHPEIILIGQTSDWGSGVIEEGGDFLIRFDSIGFYHYSCHNATDETAPVNDSCGTIVVY